MKKGFLNSTPKAKKGDNKDVATPNVIGSGDSKSRDILPEDENNKTTPPQSPTAAAPVVETPPPLPPPPAPLPPVASLVDGTTSRSAVLEFCPAPDNDSSCSYTFVISQQEGQDAAPVQRIPAVAHAGDTPHYQGQAKGLLPGRYIHSLAMPCSQPHLTTLLFRQGIRRPRGGDC